MIRVEKFRMLSMLLIVVYVLISSSSASDLNLLLSSPQKFCDKYDSLLFTGDNQNVEDAIYNICIMASPYDGDVAVKKIVTDLNEILSK